MGYNNRYLFSLLWVCRWVGLSWSVILSIGLVPGSSPGSGMWHQVTVGPACAHLCDCRNARGQPSFTGRVHPSHCFMVVNILLAKASHRTKAQIKAGKWHSTQHKSRARVGKNNSASVERSIAGWLIEHSFSHLLMPCHRWIKKKLMITFSSFHLKGSEHKLVHDL